MRTSLVCKLAGVKEGELVLLDGDIVNLDLYTSNFDDSEQLICSDTIVDKVGAFMYDNAPYIDDDVGPELLIRCKLDKEDFNLLEPFVDVDASCIYLPAVFQGEVESSVEIENFIRGNSFPYGFFFLHKVKNSDKKYLYLRIYKNYILERNERKSKKAI